MNQDEKKRAVAEAALEFIEPDSIVGVGTGSTVNFFIECLAKGKPWIDGAVSSSAATEKLLRENNIRVLDLNLVNDLSVYVDGADESTRHLHLIKGGGGALTREKIVAQAAKQFVCIVDDSKVVDRLGKFPLPVEVLPMAQSLVAREIVKLGGQPVLRAGFTTDNGNVIIDIKNLQISEPAKLESDLNQIPGVVTNGLFARRPADVLLIATNSGVERMG